MHSKFIHRKTDALTGLQTRYVHRYPLFDIQAGLYEALKPVAKRRGYTSVNEMIAVEGKALVMRLLLEDC
jgi:hypothetical protein